jgi:hypothetical protein
VDIESWPINRPIPYARNARKLSAQAIDKVAASIREFGFRQPILVDKAGTIICGHTRLQGAQKLGLETVPVHIAENLTPAQVRAYRLMDNRSHQESDWDLELLGPEISELRDLCFDLELTGFDTREIDSLLLGDELDVQEDAVPDLPENPVSKVGGLWLCGPHRVLCADSCEENAVSRLCGRTRPNLMATDPPYGVSYDPSWRVEVDGGGRHALGKVANDDQVDWTAGSSCSPATSRTSGTPVFMPAKWRQVFTASISKFVRRLSGRNNILFSAAATTTGATSRAGTPCAKARNLTGAATARRARCGR